MVISFEGPLAPHALRARTRTKYVPAPTPVAIIDVDRLPVSLCAASVAPGREPASITYDVGLPAAPIHASVTVEPLTSERRAAGAAGGPAHVPPPLPTTRVTV